MEPFLIILLIVVGYFVLLGYVMKHADNSKYVTSLAVIVLALYGCLVGGLIAVKEYLGELGLFLYGAAIIYSVFFWGWKIYSTWKDGLGLKFGAAFTLAAYLLAVLYITNFMREGGTNFQVQMTVFNWLSGAEQAESFEHILLNTALFVPVGVLLPLVVKGNKTKLSSCISFGLFFSVLIETGQLIFHYGTCDIDDILANTMGTAMGAISIILGLKRKMRRERK